MANFKHGVAFLVKFGGFYGQVAFLEVAENNARRHSKLLLPTASTELVRLSIASNFRRNERATLAMSTSFGS